MKLFKDYMAILYGRKILISGAYPEREKLI